MSEVITSTLDRAPAETAKPVRYCEDCRFYLANADGAPGYARCKYPRAQSGIMLVTRNAIRERFCSLERTGIGNDSCGPEAKWFTQSNDAPLVRAGVGA